MGGPQHTGTGNLQKHKEPIASHLRHSGRFNGSRNGVIQQRSCCAITILNAHLLDLESASGMGVLVTGQNIPPFPLGIGLVQEST